MFKRILLAIDGAAQSPRIIATAGELASCNGAQVHVVCAVDRAFAMPRQDALEYPPAEQEQQEAQALVDQAVAQLQPCVAAGAVVAGDPARAILREAERLECDLIVIGHRHLGRIERLLDPSVGQRVIERAPCPVLVEVRE
ncbi:universal stress protein [Pseudomonas sp. BGr12]|uniref:universal stress protein n=1 Tax=unclassified Pseudomonas TaxID=196821 RepID=UPI00177BBEB6|nr:MULTISPECIES: universal stress protein [unclassified Pseudomonas]MBD9504452.1 universal stress protein [Pseudomonas sp. PDM17]MBD9577964.1 universal stress protein [Pseudomonas sp. PDM23]MBD9672522.1 universal stress protein [Pseudomonas sp. PDM21]MDL2430680.1 universal stress protein [Pseudomonas sp. BJa5]